MPIPRTGIALTTLRRPLRAALEFASRAGADGVEFDLRVDLPPADLTASAVRELRKLLGDLRLAPAAAAFPTRRGFDDPDQLDRRIAAAAAAIKSAAQIGARTLVLRSGPVPGEEDNDRRGLLSDSLTTLARHADHHGVQLALVTPAKGYARLPGLLESLPRPTLGVCLEPSELVASGQPAAEAAALLGPLTTHLYASDAVRDLSTRSAVPVEFGRGSVDWPELLALLEEHDYHGWAVLKLREGGHAQELENAVAYLRALGS